MLLSAMKELPATLILRPTGVETLATEFAGNLGAVLNDFRHGLLQRELSLWFRLHACG